MVEGGRAGVPKESQGEAISVGAAWAAVKDPGLKSGEKLGLVIQWWNQSLWRISRRGYWVKVQPSCRRGPQPFGNNQYRGTITKDRSSHGAEWT